jgi:hypothetical protein
MMVAHLGQSALRREQWEQILIIARTEPQRKKARLITGGTRTDLGKEEMMTPVGYLGRIAFRRE